MGRPGFWDDQETAAKSPAPTLAPSAGWSCSVGSSPSVGELDELAELAEEDEEIEAELEGQLAGVESRLFELEEARLFSGEYDAGDAVVTVHAGAGGTDSQDWAEILLRMYLRWSERRGFDVEMAEASAGEEAGLKSATFIARGENAYGLFAAERGVHRLVRISPFDSSGRRHTSFAQVDVGPLVEGNVEVDIDESDLRIDTYRASGAGGQHVNKTDSAVRITHIPTNTVVQCQNERSQTQNKAVAMQLLKSKLIELEERKRSEELAKARGEVKDVAWGSQIRSYVLHPYTMVKDHRTEHEVGDVGAGARRRPRRFRPRLPGEDRRLVGELGLGAMPPLITIERSAEGEPDGLLVLHHGRGTDEADLLGLADVARPGAAAAGDLGARAAAGARLAGVPLVPGSAGRLPRPGELRRRPRALAELHDGLWEETGIGPERTVLAGFSMGAVMSHAMGWSAERPVVAGVLGFSGFMPTVSGWRPSFEGRTPTRAFIAHGTGTR